jgi:(R,R)-butanediol dehydrogenase/meso-butanediol dehydrogenase/diacetyl reductase
VVFDTAGDNTALSQGIRSLRPHGTLVSVAGWGEPARVDMGIAMANEIDIRFSITYEPAVEFPATMAMLADGRFDAAAMITDHIPLDRVVEDGLEELLHHSDRHVKILVDPA